MSQSILPTLTATPATVQTQQMQMSYEAFLAWEHDGIAEWVNGTVFLMSVKQEHQRIVDFLNALLRLFVKLSGLGTVITAPYVMRVKPAAPGREPDLMFIAQANLARLTSEQLNGPADLVIEVISDESVNRDRVEKFEEYEDAGVREYWLIDSRPNRQRADFYVLNEKGRYRAMPIEDDQIYRSTLLPNFWLNVNWLWEQDPDVLTAFAAVVGPDAVIRALKK